MGYSYNTIFAKVMKDMTASMHINDLTKAWGQYKVKNTTKTIEQTNG